MKDTLYLAGYDLSFKKITGFAEGIPLLYIANRDGSARWIWNSDADEPFFLKYYNDDSKMSWLFSKFIQILFALQLQRLFFKQKKWFPRNSYKKGVPLAVFAFFIFTSTHSFAHVTATDGVAVSSVLNEIVSTDLPYSNNNFKH